MKLTALLTVFLVLVLTALAASTAGAYMPPDPENHRPHHLREPVLSVAGRGEISARPDRATIILGAVWQADQASEAQQNVNRIMTRAFEQVRALEIPEESISTVGLSLEPVYSRPGRGEHDFEPRIVGFRARNAIRIQVDDLARIGPVIDAGIDAGANQLQGLHFELRDDRRARQEALRRAVEDARLKAQTISEAMGVRLEHVMEVSEAEVEFRPPRPYFAGDRVAMAEAVPTPVQPGQLQVEARLTVRYAIAEGGAEQP